MPQGRSDVNLSAQATSNSDGTQCPLMAIIRCGYRVRCADDHPDSDCHPATAPEVGLPAQGILAVWRSAPNRPNSRSRRRTRPRWPWAGAGGRRAVKLAPRRSLPSGARRSPARRAGPEPRFGGGRGSRKESRSDPRNGLNPGFARCSLFSGRNHPGRAQLGRDRAPASGFSAVRRLSVPDGGAFRRLTARGLQRNRPG